MDSSAPAPVVPPSPRAMSRWAVAANVAALAVLAAGSVAFVSVMATLPRIEGQIPAAGLEEPATISRDAAGLAYVDARSQHDAYFALGWLHAQDRLWQMDVQRRVATGRLAELIGPAGLNNDRFMRTLGLGRLADAGMAELDQPTREALSAYADGINAWIADNGRRLPPEYLALSAVPEPWRPADSLAWARVMALRLGGDWSEKLVRARLAGRLSKAQLADLWPTASGPATVAALSEEESRLTERALAAVPETVRPHQASNVWVVDGRHSATGKPLLASDPHLSLQGGALWYLVSVRAPGLRLSGATIPGLPFHLIAHNGRVAWGITSTQADTADLFLEHLTTDGQVQTPDGPKPLTIRQETIHVAGAADQVVEVRESGHGPIISDVVPELGTMAVALKSTALSSADHTAQAMYHLNRAVDWNSFVAALADFDAPVQNFAMADLDGTIGFATAGRVPRRHDGDGQGLIDGAAGRGAWDGWIAPAALPRQVNPPAGMIVNANNRPTARDDIATALARHWPDSSRAVRITTLLEQAPPLDRAAMARLQTDVTSLPARAVLDLLGQPGGLSPLAREAIDLLAGWDGVMDKDLPQPLIFNAWVETLWKRIFATPLGTDFARMRNWRPQALIAALSGQSGWCDDLSTPAKEDCQPLIGPALEDAVAALGRRWGKDPTAWRWGQAHRVVFDHPLLGRLPLVGALFEASAATGGDNFTIDRGTFAPESSRPDSFRHVHGPGLRAVFDLSDLGASTFILAPGQSGNPLSCHSADLIGAWVDNRGLTMAAAGARAAVITLTPAR